MEKLDGRKLDHKTREEIRIRAVQMVEAGESPEDVVRVLGFHRSCIYDWLARYRDGGLEALRAKPIPGREPSLSEAQMVQLFDLVTQKNPRQLQFDFGLWTRQMVRQVIRDRFGVELCIQSVGRLLRKMGLSPQKPLHQAIQRDPERVNRWLKEEYPLIRALAKKEDALIFFGDEAGIRSDYHSGTPSPKGQTPVVKSTGARFGLNMISAINAKGEMRFMTVDGKVNAEVFRTFLGRLIDNQPQPIFLILDGHSIHKARKIQQFVAETQGRLRLFHLPPHAPDLNPDELVWNHVKNHRVGKQQVTDPKGLKESIISVLQSLQKFPEKIRVFFRKPSLQYALS